MNTPAPTRRRERLAVLERRTQRIFHAAITAAFEETWEEAKRLDLGSLQLEDLMKIMRHALEAARAEIAGL